ncbi:MAG TPA: haloalkane dehalogenase [Candidatus Dormibacteraeota bacterium]
MEILRTPDERFEGLPAFPYEPHYADVDGIRIAYVDEGARDANPVLLLHGEPTWSFLYRKIIPVLTAAGLRAIAPDLPGFGRSDKPSEPGDYTYARYVTWIRTLVEQLDLTDATLFGQDWGGLIGLRVVTEIPDRFARIVTANTGLPDGLHKPSDAWFAFRDFSQNVEELPVGFLVKSGCLRGLDDEAVAAYEAPFPTEPHKVAARTFPLLIPTTEDDPGAVANRQAWEVLARWEKPFHCCFSDGDPITRGADRPFIKLIPGAQRSEHITIEGAGHFLQEDAGEEVGAAIVHFCGMG